MTDTLLGLVTVLVWLDAPLLAAGVLCALLYLTRQGPDDGSDDGPPGGDGRPDAPPPAPPVWDWDRFERDLHEYDRQLAH